MNEFDLLKNALRTTVGRLENNAVRAAAVCALVAGRQDSLSICLIRRSRRPGDPWSGHIALPGGTGLANEAPEETARREVAEEVGIRIDRRGELIALPRVRIRLAGQRPPLFIDSFVHFVGDPPPALQHGGEVESAFWVPVDDLWDSRNLCSLVLEEGGEIMMYQGLRIEQGTVFGITLRVLTLLSDCLGCPLGDFEDLPAFRRSEPGAS